jgi:uncharacterized protein (TIGR00661 family)
MNTRRVLITPLDWGLGHATRCIPIINEFLSQGCEVFIGSSGGALILLRNEFPGLKIFELAPYAPIYSASSSLVWKLAQQSLKFIRIVNREHKQTEEIVSKENIDLVISDNRYGCWSHKAKSIFITHQVNILLPPEVKWLEGIINYFNHYQIKNFSSCWIPDQKGDDNLTGRLSETSELTIKYIGTLSRFINRNNNQKQEVDVLVVLSGPEPQRSILENSLVQKLQSIDKSVWIVRGIPGDSGKRVEGNISIVDFLNTAELQNLVEQSNLIIARSGYTTIMDLEVLGGSVVFVPTPGQSEQEYLADRLKKKGIAFFMKQDEFDIGIAIKESKRYAGFQKKENNQMLLQQAISNLIDD